jgi:PAS domain S-box-containing protein
MDNQSFNQLSDDIKEPQGQQILAAASPQEAACSDAAVVIVEPTAEPAGAEPSAASLLHNFANNPEWASYRLAAIVESADDAIVSKTLQGVITTWNKGAERLFGYTAEEAIGKHISILIPPDHLDEEPQILARLRQGEKIEHYETVRVRKDGQLLNISLTVSPIRAADGTIIGASKIARDITERKANELLLQRALAEAEQAKSEAEEANRLKDQFLSTISHELRTPLTAIMGWMTMIRSGQLEEPMVLKALEIIDRNIKAQAQMTEDLLDISRIVNGKMRIDLKPLNLSAVIHAAIDTILPTAKAKDIEIQKVINPGVGFVVGDFDRLQQVIWNLLSNAIKFTPGGGRIRIELKRSGCHVEVAVGDTGMGISTEFLPYIFDRFTQEDSSSTRAYGGLGMGLSIAKYIIELHGGTIKAFSAGEGQGAVFTIILPLPQPSGNRHENCD